MMMNKIKIQNIWKWLFFALLAVNVAIVIYAILLFRSSPENPIFPVHPQPEENDMEFTISTDTENLNQLINQYISQLSEGSSASYSVVLGKKVWLTGYIHAFNQEIPATVILDPVVQDNGDLILEHESISLGRLQLPNRRVLDYIQANYEMPEWIEVDPDQENIYVAITDISNHANIQVKAEQFDLENDQISFSVHAPYEVLPYNKNTILNYFK